jgi:hypothetical protein
MLSIQQTCQPRPDILRGSFNPEIFTASLSHVVDHYRGRPAVTHAPYTDAEQFFRDATYPTEGLRMVLTDVLSRLAGDHSVPALHRLETAFGGGKTHALNEMIRTRPLRRVKITVTNRSPSSPMAFHRCCVPRSDRESTSTGTRVGYR